MTHLNAAEGTSLRDKLTKDVSGKAAADAEALLLRILELDKTTVQNKTTKFAATLDLALSSEQTAVFMIFDEARIEVYVGSPLERPLTEVLLRHAEIINSVQIGQYGSWGRRILGWIRVFPWLLRLLPRPRTLYPMEFKTHPSSDTFAFGRQLNWLKLAIPPPMLAVVGGGVISSVGVSVDNEAHILTILAPTGAALFALLISAGYATLKRVSGALEWSLRE